jgi:hypothetical protein
LQNTFLDLIAEQYKAGKTELADALIDKLQFPLTLGSFIKSLDIGREYLKRLLQSRMIPYDKEAVERIARELVEGYADHGACILCDEAQTLGLNVKQTSPRLIDTSWQ